MHQADDSVNKNIMFGACFYMVAQTWTLRKLDQK
jgi:hypothetical protein